MSDRLRAMSDDELGARLAGLDLDWPETPDLAASVTAATRQLRAARRPTPLPRSRARSC